MKGPSCFAGRAFSFVLFGSEFEIIIFALRLWKIDSLAQLVEQYTFNVWVLGSSPKGITGET